MRVNELKALRLQGCGSGSRLTGYKPARKKNTGSDRLEKPYPYDFRQIIGFKFPK